MTTDRPYQTRAVEGVCAGWQRWQRQLGVMATGGGKTRVFSRCASLEKGRTLILAHRAELINQAVDKLHAATGINASIEMGAQRALPGHGVIVASVQSMTGRLSKYAPDAFDLVIADEAHHALADEWQGVLNHFSAARVLGVTATPSRADKKKLGTYFQNIAFEVGLLELIGDGWLSPIRSLRLDVEIDARSLRKSKGDISAKSNAEAISPLLKEIAKKAAFHIWDKKCLVFLPRCDVSEDFAYALQDNGINALHVAGNSPNRTEVLQWFAEPGPRTLCNAMLLTEGFDQPDIDCVLILRATQSREMYAQIVGRGTRIFPGKEFLTILDPLWLTGSIDLCCPADLTAASPIHREKLQARMDEGLDLIEAESVAKWDVEEALEASLREAAKLRKAPKGLVDPLAWAIGIHDSDLSEYSPCMPWEEEPPTVLQDTALRAAGMWTENITAGFATRLLQRLAEREALGLATPKQVILCRQFGNPNAETLTKAQAGYFLGQRMRRAA